MAANAQDPHAPLRPEGKKDEDRDEESASKGRTDARGGAKRGHAAR